MIMVPPSSLATLVHCLDSNMSMNFLPDQCKIASSGPAIGFYFVVTIAKAVIDYARFGNNYVLHYAILGSAIPVLHTIFIMSIILHVH